MHPDRIREISQYILNSYNQKTHRLLANGKGFNAMFAVSSVALKDLQKIDTNDKNAVALFKDKHHIEETDLESMQVVHVPSERSMQDYRSNYNDIREWLRNEQLNKETDESDTDWSDVVFEVDLIKSQEINLDYILELIFEENKGVKDKAVLIDDVRRAIRANIDSRAKESLVVYFINHTDLDDIADKASIIENFYKFAQAKQREEAQALINDDNLNESAAKRYIETSLKKEFASENGTELNSIMPKMSPLNPLYLTKKQSVFKKISTFIEKFKGVGGKI